MYTENQAIKPSKAQQPVGTPTLLDLYKLAAEQGTALPHDAVEVNVSNFLRLSQGANKFRVVSPAVYGKEVWFRRVMIDEEGELLKNEDGSEKMESRVMRFGATDVVRTPADLTDEHGWMRDKPRAFIGVLVYNYATGKVECFSASKKDLYDPLFQLFRGDDDVASVFKVDINITKKSDGNRMIKGKSIEVFNHFVQTSREKETPDEVLHALSSMDFIPDLNRLFIGEDPFDVPEIATAELAPEQEQKGVAEAIQGADSLTKNAAKGSANQAE